MADTIWLVVLLAGIVGFFWALIRVGRRTVARNDSASREALTAWVGKPVKVLARRGRLTYERPGVLMSIERRDIILRHAEDEYISFGALLEVRTLDDETVGRW